MTCRAALERKKQRAEAKGLAEIVTSREALKLQLEMESNPEYFIPGEKSSHKPPKATQHGVEARPVAEGNPERGRGRGRGRGKGRGRGRGRGRFSKLPSATDLARRILEAKQVMEQSSSDPEMAISTTTTRSQSNLRSSQSDVHIEDASQSEPQIEDASQSEPQIEDASQSEPHQQRRSHRRQPGFEDLKNSPGSSSSMLNLEQIVIVNRALYSQLIKY